MVDLSSIATGLVSDTISTLLGGNGGGSFFNGATSRFRLFSPQGYNIPKPKFMYYVNFVSSNIANTNRLGFFVKRIDRLQMTYEIIELNQYNKKRLVQGKLQYGPLNFSFYDVADGSAVKLVEAYNRFYYGDFQGKNDTSWNYDIIGSNFEFAPNWGLSGQVSPNANNFIERIEIYEIYDQVYSQIDFINPKFTNVDMANLAIDDSNGNEINIQAKYEGVVFKAIAQPVTQAIASMAGLPYHNDIFSALLGGLNIPGLDISSGVGLPGQSLLSSIANVVNNKTNGGTVSPAFNAVNSVLNGVIPNSVSNTPGVNTINGYFGSTIGGGQPTMSFLSPLSSLSSILPGVQSQTSAGQSVRNVSQGSFNILGPLETLF